MSGYWASAGWRRWPTVAGDVGVCVTFDEVDGQRAVIGLEIWGTRPPKVAVPADVWQRVSEIADELLRSSPSRTRTLAAELGVVAGRTGRAPAHAFPADRVTPITSVIARLPVQKIAQESLEDVRQLMQAVMAAPAGDNPQDDEIRRLAYLAEASDYARGRPVQHDIGFYRQVAKYWLAAQPGGRPTSDLAAKHHVHKSVAAKWVARCRSLGLLPPSGGRGRAISKEEHNDG